MIQQYYYKVEGCVLCGRRDGHWHMIDPRPLDGRGEAKETAQAQDDTVLGQLEADLLAKDLEKVPPLIKLEPPPIFQPGTSRVVWPTLYAYMKKRVERGLEKYGQELSTHDSRNGLHDALDEAVDLCFYLMKVMLEEQEKRIHEYEELSGKAGTVNFGWYEEGGLRGGIESGY